MSARINGLVLGLTLAASPAWAQPGGWALGQGSVEPAAVPAEPREVPPQYPGDPGRYPVQPDQYPGDPGEMDPHPCEGAFREYLGELRARAEALPPIGDGENVPGYGENRYAVLRQGFLAAYRWLLRGEVPEAFEDRCTAPDVDFPSPGVGLIPGVVQAPAPPDPYFGEFWYGVLSPYGQAISGVLAGTTALSFSGAADRTALLEAGLAALIEEPAPRKGHREAGVAFLARVLLGSFGPGRYDEEWPRAAVWSNAVSRVPRIWDRTEVWSQAPSPPSSHPIPVTLMALAGRSAGGAGPTLAAPVFEAGLKTFAASVAEDHEADPRLHYFRTALGASGSGVGTSVFRGMALRRFAATYRDMAAGSDPELATRCGALAEDADRLWAAGERQQVVELLSAAFVEILSEVGGGEIGEPIQDPPPQIGEPVFWPPPRHDDATLLPASHSPRPGRVRRVLGGVWQNLREFGRSRGGSAGILD